MYPCCLTHTTQEHSARTPHPPDLRPDRPLRPVASHAARGAHERKHSTRLRHGRMARSTSVCATHTHTRDSTSPLSAIASAHLATLTCAPLPPPPLRRTLPILIGRCPAVLNHMTPMKTCIVSPQTVMTLVSARCGWGAWWSVTFKHK